MININIKVKKHWGSLIPTGVFWVSDFIDSQQLDGLLHEARAFVPGLTYNDLVNENEVHLVGSEHAGKWSVITKSKIEPSIEDIKEHTLLLARMTNEAFMSKDRHEPKPLIRSIVAAAYYHFLKMPFSETESHVPTDRTTIYTACRASLPKFLRSRDLMACEIVHALAYRYGDPSFEQRCQEGNFLTKPRYEELH